MNLIERYLNEVGRRLPAAKREDIRNELRSSLEDALESRAAGEATEDDVVAVLREFGPPEAVAASYTSDRYLIGPKLYPQFLTTLRVVLTVLGALIVLASALSMFGADGSGLARLIERAGDVVGKLIDSGVTALGVVVIVFAVLERLEVGDQIVPKPWDPRRLPAVRDADLVGRFDSIAGIVFPAVILILMNQFKDHVGLRIQPGSFAVGVVPGEGKLLLNEVFLDNLPWLNTSLLLPMCLSVWLFWSGRWHWWSRVIKIAFDLFGLFVAHRLCQGAIAARTELLAGGVPEAAVAVFVQSARIAPFVVAGFVLFDAVRHLYRGSRSLALHGPGT